ncbi:MAG: N-acetylneuraminate synthase family protein [Patescibacteria group bacterium]|nr:N-acetylneuraminate synthase family protein [Patescibacteria group bacterium]
MFIKVDNRLIGPGQPTFIIAEIGINHNGSLPMALELVRVCKEIGCDAVKFQKRTVPVVYQGQLDAPRAVDPSIIQNARARTKIEGVQYEVFPPSSLVRLAENPSNTTNGDLKYALELGLKEFDMIDRLCRDLGILWSASAWDGLSAHFINGYDVQWLKIASPCMTNSDLLRRVCRKGKPVFLSTGGSTMEQVEKAIAVLREENEKAEIVLLHCVSVYPTLDDQANIRLVDTLRLEFPKILIGYSGHEGDDLASLVAVKHGACVVERHITLDRNLPGSDHKVSLDPDQFRKLVEKIRQFEEEPASFDSLVGPENLNRVPIIEGDGTKKVLPSEVSVMEKLRRVNDL